jgi:hypothetical protein
VLVGGYLQGSLAQTESRGSPPLPCTAGRTATEGPQTLHLFAGAPGAGRVNGTLAQGTITAPDAGNACGWTHLAAVLAAINSGNTYVNVHTNDGVPPANTGPGGLPRRGDPRPDQ